MYCNSILQVGCLLRLNVWVCCFIKGIISSVYYPTVYYYIPVGNKNCSSRIGWTARNVPSHEPTMHLDLHKGGNLKDRQKQRHVIHEFGHALGLRHEHQRSDFWERISPYVDEDKMKSDTRANMRHLSDDRFQAFWCTNFEVSSQLNPSEYDYTQYDPTSIMHYP